MDSAIKLVIYIILLIPIVAYHLIKWLIAAIAAIFTFIVKTIIAIYKWVRYGSSKNIHKSIDLSEIDKMDGIAFENLTAELLRNNGFKNVEVTKATGDYGVDIVANKDNNKYAFQCKCYCSKLGINPIQEVYTGLKMYGADTAVVITNSYFTPNAYNLANELGVLLWDREEYIRLLKQAQWKVNNYNEDSSSKHAIPIKYIDESINSEQTVETISASFNYGQAIESINSEQTIESSSESTKINTLIEKPIDYERISDDMATILSVGRYIFGKNIPYGMYDLIAISGGGWLTIYNKESEEDMIWLGERNNGEYVEEYRGLDSDVVKQFTIDENLKAKIIKTQMIAIEDQ